MEQNDLSAPAANDHNNNEAVNRLPQQLAIGTRQNQHNSSSDYSSSEGDDEEQQHQQPLQQPVAMATEPFDEERGGEAPASPAEDEEHQHLLADEQPSASQHSGSSQEGKMLDDDESKTFEPDGGSQQSSLKKPRLQKARLCGPCPAAEDEAESQRTQEADIKTRTEIERVFREQQTFEIWIIFIFKFLTSLIILIDDLTFLLFCQYEFKMTQFEAGTLFCFFALSLFFYGLFVAGIIIDKMGIKNSLLLGLILYAITKFCLIFTESRWQLYLLMTTIGPFGISILFPVLILGVKKLTKENARPQAFSFFYGAMILGAVVGGPIVDLLRLGKSTKFSYSHTNEVTGEEEERIEEFSAWRTIMFFAFVVNLVMIFVLLCYNPKVEKQFEEEGVDWDQIAQLTVWEIFAELLGDYRFWRFVLFSFVIVGPKLVFALLFFMLPRIILQDYGEDAPFGILVAIAPIMIIIFLYIFAPLQANYDAYDLILLGTTIATFGPVPMFFGMNIVSFLFFILIISIAEAIYAPMVNVFTFNFTKPGREGTFLTLTAAPLYFTMACTGLLGGFLLENFYPPDDDTEHQKQPWVIWLTIIVISGTSTLTLFLCRSYFNCVEDIEEAENASQSKKPPTSEEGGNVNEPDQTQQQQPSSPVGGGEVTNQNNNS